MTLSLISQPEVVDEERQRDKPWLTLVLYKVQLLELPGSTDCCYKCFASKGDTAVTLGEQSDTARIPFLVLVGALQAQEELSLFPNLQLPLG